VALRPHLPKGALFVLCGPLAGTEDLFDAHRLIPVLNTTGQIAQWRACADRLGRTLPAAIHIDTGMNRLGLEERQVAAIADDPAALAGIEPLLIMSHMARADEDGVAMNAEQRDRFARLSARLPGRRSLGASSTIFLGPDYHFDLVRPGAALYGVNPTPGRPNPMAPVARLEARILQVRDVDTPMTVGYGATHRVAGKSRIATVAIGYADGYFRCLGNRGHGIIGGHPVPVVGRVSMDLITVDIGRLPPDTVRPGMMMELIGPQHDVDALAAEAGTIGYEVLTNAGRRAIRRYVGDPLSLSTDQI
jgi:alanine racemase